MQNILIFISGVVSLALLDYIWIGLIFADFYKSSLAPIARMIDGQMKPNVLAFMIAYALISAGIMIFILPRAASFPQTILFGAVFGFIIVGVYNFSNYSLLKDWTFPFVVRDTLWATANAGLTALIMFFIRNFLIR